MIVIPRPHAPTPSASKRAQAVLQATLKRRQSERVAYIDGACGEDEALREEVIALLDSGESTPLALDKCGVIVQTALERRRTERLAFVEGACGNDEELKARVLATLSAADISANPAVRVIKPAVEPTPASADDEATRIAPRATTAPQVAPAALPVTAPTWLPGQPMEGRRIGPYQLLHSLGKGGMGSVYAASRADQEYKKIVAIKLVTVGLGTEEMLRRFRNERQVLAGLDHPYIARLLDGGSTDDGFPYLVMEFVEGLTITQYCESHQLSITDKLKLFQKVCSAVQFAHQNLVVHRDLKPANILVCSNGEPKLLDFGIAKLMTAEFSAEEIELNRGEAQPMTLRYASPEQVRGEPITTASDIYSLGVLLYELLAGVHPFQSALTSRSEIEQAIRAREPAKPSDAVKARANATTANNTEKHRTAKLVKELCGDIDIIVLTALQKQPRERYPSSESFAWDITRYLNGFPVYARRDDMGYRSRKFIRRHAATVMGAALVVIALIVSSIVSLQFAQTARAQKANAQSRFEDVRKLARFVLFDLNEKIRNSPTEARKVLVTEALDYLNRLAKDSVGDASLQRELTDGYLKVGDLQGNPNEPNLGDSSGARASYTKALDIAQTQAGSDPNDTHAREALARVNTKLGDLSEYSGNQSEALKSYRQGQAILERLIEKDPSAKNSLVLVFQKIGTVQLQLGDTKAALDSFRRYLQIAEELSTANRSDVNARRLVAIAYQKLGATMADAGALSESLEKLNMARSIYEELEALHPQSSNRRYLASVNMMIGDTRQASGKKDEAVDSFRRALKITETLAAEDPKNTQYQRDLHVTLGRLSTALGRSAEAWDATDRALQVLRPMVDAPNVNDYEIHQYCWLLVTTPFKDLQAPAIARHYADLLVQKTGGKNPAYLDLLARAFDSGGDERQAVDTESKAIALLPPGSASGLRTELEENLTQFRARAEGKQRH